MQLKKSEYNSRKHDKHRALSVRQPFADYIAMGEKTIELRNRYSSYRGYLVICSTARPEIEDRHCGSILCIVELYDVVKTNTLTSEEIKQTKVPKEKLNRYLFAWKLRNVRRVIEKPVIGNQNIWVLYCKKDYIELYPDELGIPSLSLDKRMEIIASVYKANKLMSLYGIYIILAILIGLVLIGFGLVKIFN